MVVGILGIRHTAFVHKQISRQESIRLDSGGRVVSVVAFYSVDPSSNPASLWLKRTKINKKKLGLAHFFKKRPNRRNNNFTKLRLGPPISCLERTNGFWSTSFPGFKVVFDAKLVPACLGPSTGRLASNSVIELTSDLYLILTPLQFLLKPNSWGLLHGSLKYLRY